MPSVVPNAVAGRDAAYSVYVLGVPAGPAAERIPAQVAAVTDALRPWRAGALLNFLGHADPAELQNLWPAADRQRLSHSAVRYDPGDTFRGRAFFQPTSR